MMRIELLAYPSRPQSVTGRCTLLVSGEEARAIETYSKRFAVGAQGLELIEVGAHFKMDGVLRSSSRSELLFSEGCPKVPIRLYLRIVQHVEIL